MPKMVDKKLQILAPRHSILENMAANFAAEWFEAARSSGMPSQYKNPREFAKAKFETFLPKAVEIAIDMLGRPDLSEEMKAPLYEALMERVNDPMLTQLRPNAIPAMDLSKFFDNKVKPIVVNTETAPEVNAEGNSILNVKPVVEKDIFKQFRDTAKRKTDGKSKVN